MATPNYERFIADLVKPIVSFPDEVVVKVLLEERDSVNVQVMVNSEDLGRVIGKKGRIANAIRTIAYAYGARNGQRLDVSIDAFELNE